MQMSNTQILATAKQWRKFDEVMQGQALVNGWADLPLKPLPRLQQYVGWVIERINRAAK